MTTPSLFLLALLFGWLRRVVLRSRAWASFCGWCGQQLYLWIVMAEALDTLLFTSDGRLRKRRAIARDLFEDVATYVMAMGRFTREIRK